MLSLSLTILTFAASPRPGWAQVSAAISGRVEDTSGSAVGGATVTVKCLETGATRVLMTNESGNFRALSLPLGPQEVKVEKAGFNSVVRTGISLEVGQEATVNVRLEVGALVQQVTVSEETPLVNTTTAPVSGIVGERELKDLPLNGRSFDNLITLNPGTINYSAMKSAETSTSNGNTFSVAGRRTAENLFVLNGIEYTGSSQLAITPGGVSGELLGIDAVREFNVLTDTYPAEYGKRAGAQVSAVTQSGTNALHGSMYEFLRNSALDARNFFAQGSIPPFHQNQFGGAAGGPLRKDRLFLFGNYEGFRQALALSNVSVVPDQEARQGFLPNASGVETKVTNLSASMLPYMSFWPVPNGPELLANGLPSGTALAFNNPRQSIREDFGTLRTDYNPRDRDSLSGAYTVDDGNSLVPLADPLFASYTALRMQVASFEETHIFSPQVLNTFRAGFSRAAFNLTSSPLASFAPSLSFVSGDGPGGIVIGGGVTTTGIAALTSAGPNNAAGAGNRRNLFTYTDSLQISKGIHQIKLGAWLQPLQDNEDTASRQLGQATFTTLQTFLQGKVSSFQVVPNHNELGWRSLFGAWYFEDAIKIRPNLTLQAGLRQEFTTGWNEASGRAANYLTDASGVLITTPRVGGSVFMENNARRLFGPRISLAWDPFGNGHTAVRAAYGTYYSLLDDLAFLLNSLPPYNGAVSFSNVALSSILPIVPSIPPPHSCGPNVPAPCTIYAPQGVDANAKTPTVQEWNLTIERQLSRNATLRVAYVGSHAYHGLLSSDPNSLPAQTCSSLGGCPSGGVGATKGKAPQGTEYIPAGTRPNPYLSSGFFWYTEGNSSYNALETEVTHRLSQGLQFRANYTWSKNLDVNSALTGAQASNQAQMVLNRNDLEMDWGLAALNITSQSSLSGSYELPFGSGKRWLGGWQINGIAALLSGFPFTPLVGSNRSGDGDTRNPDRPSVNPDFTGPVLLRSPNQWFNPNAFTLPAAGTYGNVGRGTLTGPGLADLDLSVLKNLPVSERASLQFRVEFFNVANHPNFGPPNSTVFANGGISASAGLITSTATTSRQIQIGLKLIF
ncbi:MAG TPA: carboxypeptidase-like regulatory domain-containing protein [Terriglobia bacterium]|nr:carboxypeptidase-like regulatory domain-containing protein [Terriglobia bacterium]